MRDRELDLAWAAGFFDGEGCVQIFRGLRRRPLKCLTVVGSPRRRIGEGISYDLRVNVSNRNKSLLNCFAELFGGGVTQKGLYGTGQRGEAWRWDIGGETAKSVLELMLPYLRGKAAVARVGIEFKTRQAEFRLRGYARTPEENAVLEAHRLELRRLIRLYHNGKTRSEFTHLSTVGTGAVESSIAGSRTA